MAFDIGRGDSAVPMTEQEIIERYAFVRTVKENCVEQMLLPADYRQ